MMSPVGGELLVEFAVPGVPASPQGRNAERKRSWTRAVQGAAEAAWRPRPPLPGALSTVINYYQTAGWAPDLDNQAKLILDAISGIVWGDDRQLVSLLSARRDLNGRYIVAGISGVLAEAFGSREPFVHIQILEPPDFGVLL